MHSTDEPQIRGDGWLLLGTINRKTGQVEAICVDRWTDDELAKSIGVVAGNNRHVSDYLKALCPDDCGKSSL